ncbi:MAG: helix-turn-helix domain-containing protein [Planctomycetota bacterium]|nr:helix-turn-helix domain-containing protein [Planctomycetota bacterium]
MQKTLSTTEFADVLGLSESSIRRMADNGEIGFHKTRGGHRKFPVEEAIRYIRANRIQLTKPEILGLTTTYQTSPGFFEALKVGESDLAVSQLIRLYLEGLSVHEICDGPMREALVKIGQTFPSDKRSIFVEHRAITICMRSLLQLRSVMPTVGGNAKRGITAAPSDDPYFLPCLMASLVLHEAGLVEINLGPDTPMDILEDAIEDEAASIVCLSLTSPIRSRHLTTEITRLHRNSKEKQCRLVIGGQSSYQLDDPELNICGSMGELSRIAREV